MSDEEVKIKVTASTGEAKEALDSLAKKTSEAGGDMHQSLSSSLKKMQASMSSSMKGMEHSAKEMNEKVTESFDKIKEAAEPLTEILAPLMAAFAAEKVLEVAADYEQVRIKMNGLMGGAKEGGEAMEYLDQKIKESPFGMETLRNSFTALKAQGLDPMNGSLQAIMDSVAKYNGSASGMEVVTKTLARAQATGKFGQREFMQMIDSGIPIMKLMTEATGKTADQVNEMAKKNQFGKDILEKLFKAMENDAPGAAAARMDTLGGATARLKNTFEGAIEKMTEDGDFHGVTDGINALTALIPSLQQAFNSGFDAIKEVISSWWEMTHTIIVGIKSGLIDLANAFGANIGEGSKPLTAMEEIKNMFKVVGIAFQAMALGFEVVFKTIETEFAEIENTIKTFAKMSEAAFHLDWAGVKSAWSDGIGNSKKIFSDGMDDLVAAADKTQKKIADILSTNVSKKEEIEDHEMVSPNAGADKTKKAKKEASKMPEYEEALQLKKIQDLETQHHAMSKAEEEAYWKSILGLASTSAKDKQAIEKKMEADHLADLTAGLAKETALKKKTAENNLKLSEDSITQEKQSSLDAITRAEMVSKEQVALKKITKVQELQAEQVFLAQKYAIESKAQQQLIELHAADASTNPVAYQKLLDGKLQIDQKYQTAKLKMQIDTQNAIADAAKKADAERLKEADSLNQNLANSMQAELIHPSIQGFKSMLESFVSMVEQMVAKAEAAKIMQSLFGAGSASGAGGGLGGMVVAAFGGGKESGGYTSGGTVYQVGEGNKPEIFKSGGKQYMIHGDNGAVISNKNIGGNSDTNNNMSITVNSTSGNPDEIKRSVSEGARQAMGALSSASRYK